MSHKVITAVTSPIIPLATLRSHLRLDLLGEATHSDDALIEAYLSAAREHAEHYTQRSVGQQTVEFALDEFPTAGIELPLGAASIVSIKYTDTALIEQTVNSTEYALDDYSFKHWAIPVTVWPTPAAVANAVKVRYTTPSTIPAAVQSALLLLVGHFYENRTALNNERGISLDEVPLGVKALLDTVRDWGV